MHYRPRPGIRWAAIGEEIILLDIQKGRFFALPSKLIATFRQSVEPPLLSPEKDAALELLAKLGIMEAVPSLRGHRNRPPSFQAIGCPQLPKEKAGLGLTVRAFLSLMSARCRVRHQPISQWIISFGELDRGTHTSLLQQARTAMIADAFARCNLLLTRTDQCLPTSLALATMLRRNGIGAKLFIGVETCPFASHSWVQVNDHVINDDPARTARFTPILVL